MKILITGSNGLLGQKIVRQLSNASKLNYLATSQGENRNTSCPSTHYCSLDITNAVEVSKTISNYSPDYIIHTAAITNVDYCELNTAECEKVNVTGTKNLFDAAKKNGTHFLFLSTDFVFDGKKGNYKETDKPNPLSVYAKSKLEGELILMNSNYSNWSIARTIIVFGEGENLSRSNIVLWAKEALSTGKVLNIIDDQFRSPTWADDLAWGCIQICIQKRKGIYHLSGPESMSIFDLVMRIGSFFKLDTSSVNRTDSSALNQPAKRPPITGFDLSKSKKDLGYEPKTLEESLLLLS
ncbi:SDR family oxidoreductase [Crocinitomicaceae bacterium]|jgi:dTDP-4-dehydrorhamnose reductase|nr:SDR family oxidoreductase [Flavobacteriales bacterium]MDC0272267.1 SDR family oxidoreductase [Crocinitomicaceae bacterium]